ncbi:FUSC family membrane protein [Nibribacter koreensis]|uniref:FUSC family protein n=1 Tax=Nibribacter koreensis TaxID=1084519 RepID=A0ABP8F4I1_9BACT
MPSKKYLQEFQYFLFSQHFSDGIKTTIGVLLPSLLASYFGNMAVGFSLSLGAICVSLADSPGPVTHKRNGMLVSMVLGAVVGLVTGYVRQYPVLLGLEILVLSFVCSMFLIYGMRASLIGLAALLVMILTLAQPLDPSAVPQFSFLILAGGAWYMVMSLLSAQIMPYRQTQQALAESIREVAKFLQIKAEFYNPTSDLEQQYHRLVTQQVLVNEKQAAVRELLFKSRLVVKDSTRKGRTLFMIFADMVDLYEQITAIHYDYTALRARFASTGVLPKIVQLITGYADALHHVSLAVQSNQTHGSESPQLARQLEELGQAIQDLENQQDSVQVLVLKKIFVNFKVIAERVQSVEKYLQLGAREDTAFAPREEFAPFVTHLKLDPQLFLQNLTLRSSVFRFSFRMAVVCLLAYVLTKAFPYGQHSYWVLLTVVFILKPGFSLTKQRNYQRLLGTLVGSFVGILVLWLVEDSLARFLFLVLFMVATYSVQRINYVWNVLFMTPFVLLVFSFLGASGLAVVQERMVDTLVGCGLAFLASYLIFPNWEAKQMKTFLQTALKANLDYLQMLAKPEITEVAYKLARKEVYVTSANLSAAFQRMASEPKNKQRKKKEVYELVVLNHILSSFIATMASGRLSDQSQVLSEPSKKMVRRASQALQNALHALDASQPLVAVDPKPLPEPTDAAVTPPEDTLLQEQLAFLNKVCHDIARTTQALS